MPRHPRSPQLDLDWTEPPRWEDLPATVHGEVRDYLRALLVQAAEASPRAEEGRDE